MPSEYTLSIIEANFRLKASIMKPRTTLTELSHPPDLGIFFIHEGKRANSVKGSANASPNPNIPTVGRSTSPEAASTSKAPTMGPVHENDTSTVVRPRKNAASAPPLSTFESEELTHPAGITISNAPKKEAAKTRNNMKNRRLGIQCVLSVFANPAPALVSDTMIPSEE